MASTPAASGNRWSIALSGVLVMLCLGTVYSWSIFTRPLLAAFNWSNQDTTFAFEMAIFFIGIGAVIGGRWQDRVGPRTVTIVGAVLWGVGVMLAGIGTAAMGKWWLYLTYGLIGGLGNGMAYVTPVAVVTKWFPDKRGLGSGLVVMGFGLGAFVYNQIVPRIGSFAAAAHKAGAYVTARDAAIKAGTTFDPTAYALSSGDVSAIMNTFIWTGVIFIVLGGLGALALKNPEDSYTVPGAVALAARTGPSYTPSQALEMPAALFTVAAAVPQRDRGYFDHLERGSDL